MSGDGNEWGLARGQCPDHLDASAPDSGRWPQFRCQLSSASIDHSRPATGHASASLIGSGRPTSRACVNGVPELNPGRRAALTPKAG